MCRSLSALAPIQLQALSRPLCYSEWTCTCFLLSSVQIKPQLRNEVSPVVRSSSPQAGFQRGRVSRYESHRDVVAALSVCTLSHKPKAMLRDHHSRRCLQCSKSPWTSNRCPWSGRHRDRGPKAQLSLLSLYILAKGCCSVDKSSSCLVQHQRSGSSATAVTTVNGLFSRQSSQGSATSQPKTGRCSVSGKRKELSAT